MEKGWLKPILEQANADRATWPAWQRGFELETTGDQTQLAESDAVDDENSADHEAAA